MYLLKYVVCHYKINDCVDWCGVDLVLVTMSDTLCSLYRYGGVNLSMGWRILCEGCICADGFGVTATWISFHRWENMFWWMMAYTIHPAQVEGVPVLVCCDAHAKQSFFDDLVRKFRSRLQYSHIRGMPGVLTVVTGHG